MQDQKISPFHRFFDKFYPLIRFYYERVRGNPWFSKITPADNIPEELWLGGAPDTTADHQFLVENGINAVLEVRAERSDDVEFYREHDITYLKVWTPDIGVPRADDISRSVDWMVKQVVDQRSILVHCAKGRGRSATILAAYLMQQHGLSFAETVRLLSDKRQLTKLESRHERRLEEWLGRENLIF